jgi:hypothetical protein
MPNMAGLVDRDCCEVDHLILLELGGSNEIKNLWPEPDDPRPGWDDKDELENELHRPVCSGEMTLADAQLYCIELGGMLVEARDAGIWDSIGLKVNRRCPDRCSADLRRRN